MFLQLAHTKFDVYKSSKELILACYKLAKQLPSEERFAMAQQIRRAALSVHLNIAEGSSRKSAVERKRFFEISRGSVVEIDAAFEVAFELEYVTNEQLMPIENSLVKTFKLLTGLINN